MRFSKGVQIYKINADLPIKIILKDMNKWI